MKIWFNHSTLTVLQTIAIATLALTISSCVNKHITGYNSYSSKKNSHEILKSDEVLKKSLSAPVPIKKELKKGDPLPNFTTANFVGSSNCSMCHEKLIDNEGNDVSVSNHWRATMMANAAKDPFWQAKVESEIKRNPSSASVIEKKCVICHMPMAWTQLQTPNNDNNLKSTKSTFDHFLNQTSALHEAAMDGVSCSLCHQIQESGLNSSKSYSGEFNINTTLIDSERPIYGPYKNVYKETMVTMGFTPTYGPHVSESAFCATCHTLYTPYVDATGVIKGEFPEQTVYLEWLQSIYGKSASNGYSKNNSINVAKDTTKTCQDCHMPNVSSGELLIANPAHRKVKPKNHFSKHHFVGGNVLMLNLMHDHLAALKISASSQDILDTRDRTLRQLQLKTARIKINKINISSGTITAVIQVDNLVGHKFPTGFPSRRTWIHVAVSDRSGNIIFESGKPLMDGSIAGDNSDEGVGYEPHYDLITKPSQVQIYESVMRNTDGNLTYTLLRGAAYIKDNRLLPYGFNKKAASPDIRVTGRAGQDENFTGGSDRTTFTIDVSKHQGPYTVNTELLYTPISYAFVNDLKKDIILPAVRRFWQYFEKSDHTPVTVATAQKISSK